MEVVENDKKLSENEKIFLELIKIYSINNLKAISDKMNEKGCLNFNIYELYKKFNNYNNDNLKNFNEFYILLDKLRGKDLNNKINLDDFVILTGFITKGIAYFYNYFNIDYDKNIIKNINGKYILELLLIMYKLPKNNKYFKEDVILVSHFLNYLIDLYIFKLEFNNFNKDLVSFKIELFNISWNIINNFNNNNVINILELPNIINFKEIKKNNEELFNSYLKLNLKNLNEFLEILNNKVVSDDNMEVDPIKIMVENTNEILKKKINKKPKNEESSCKKSKKKLIYEVSEEKINNPLDQITEKLKMKKSPINKLDIENSDQENNTNKLNSIKNQNIETLKEDLNKTTKQEHNLKSNKKNSSNDKIAPINLNEHVKTSDNNEIKNEWVEKNLNNSKYESNSEEDSNAEDESDDNSSENNIKNKKNESSIEDFDDIQDNQSNNNNQKKNKEYIKIKDYYNSGNESEHSNHEVRTNNLLSMEDDTIKLEDFYNEEIIEELIKKLYEEELEYLALKDTEETDQRINKYNNDFDNIINQNNK